MIVGKNQIATRVAAGAIDADVAYARLVLRKRDGSTIVVSLRHRTNLVGSADGCRVRLRSTDIAPLHAVITRDPTGLQIRRLAPSGRLEVNREPIDVGYLRNGDRIRVGPVSMQLSTNLHPIESTALLEGFAQHVKARLAADLIETDDEIADGSRPQSPESDTEKESEAVHRWHQLAEQLEQQEQLLGQVERRLGVDGESSDPRVQTQVQQLSQIHDRIRNEIALLRIGLKTNGATVFETSAKSKKESNSPRTVNQRPSSPSRPKVIMKDHNTKAPGTVVVDDFSCDECCGVVFRPRTPKWYEIPAWLMFLRGVECTKCAHQTLHFASKIKILQ